MLKAHLPERIPDPTASREKRFLQVSLFSPLVVPLIPLVASPLVLGLEVGGALTVIGFILMFSLVLGGVPYLLFLIGLFAWMRNKDADQVLRMTCFAPLLFIPVLVICALIAGVVSTIATGEPAAIFSALGFGAICSIFALVLGYFYVGIVDSAFLLLRKLERSRLRLQ